MTDDTASTPEWPDGAARALVAGRPLAPPERWLLLGYVVFPIVTMNVTGTSAKFVAWWLIVALAAPSTRWKARELLLIALAPTVDAIGVRAVPDEWMPVIPVLDDPNRTVMFATQAFVQQAVVLGLIGLSALWLARRPRRGLSTDDADNDGQSAVQVKPTAGERLLLRGLVGGTALGLGVGGLTVTVLPVGVLPLLWLAASAATPHRWRRADIVFTALKLAAVGIVWSVLWFVASFSNGGAPLVLLGGLPLLVAVLGTRSTLGRRLGAREDPLTGGT